jgi:HK97 family phage major capsid protein
MSGQIVKKVFDTTPWRQYCSTQTISTASLEGLEDRGEVGSGWVAEQGTRTETSSPEIGKWSIPVHELYAEPRATQKLLDDSSVDIESWLVGKIAEKFARVQNNAFVNGSGVDKPRGFATYPTAATPDSTRPWGTIEHVATGNAGAFPSSNPADVLMDVIYALKATYRQGAMWACPKEVLGEIRKMKDSDGQYLWRPGLSEGEPSRLLDYAIIESEDIPALAAGSLSVAFGNFSRAYQIVDRIGIRVLRDPFTSKPYVKFYTTTRVGGAVIDYEALKFVKFS